MNSLHRWYLIKTRTSDQTHLVHVHSLRAVAVMYKGKKKVTVNMIMQLKPHVSSTWWIQTALIVIDILNWSIASMSYSEQLWHIVNVWTSVRTCSEFHIQKRDRVHWSSVLQICQSTCGWDAKTFTRPRGLPQCVSVCKFTIHLQKNNSTSLQPMTSLTYRKKEMVL